MVALHHANLTTTCGSSILVIPGAHVCVIQETGVPGAYPLRVALLETCGFSTDTNLSMLHRQEGAKEPWCVTPTWRTFLNPALSHWVL